MSKSRIGKAKRDKTEAKKLQRDKEIDEVIQAIADSMGAKVVRWDTMDEAIEQDLTFCQVVDISRWTSEKEMKMLEFKTMV